jgi:hypothetical protein
VLSEVTGKPIKCVKIGDEAWYKTVRGWGLPHAMAYFLASINTYYRYAIYSRSATITPSHFLFLIFILHNLTTLSHESFALVGNRYHNEWVQVVTGEKPKSWKEFITENRSAFV